MSSPPLAILSAPGSRGDVNPMIAIGVQLRELGYDVAISLAEPYAALARDAGLDPHPLIDRETFDELLSDPAFWKLARGMYRVIRGIVADYLPLHFQKIQELHRPGNTVLVSHPLDFASRIFRDLDPTTPLVDVHLAPLMLRVPEQPAHLTPWRLEPTRLRSTFKLAYWLGDALFLDPLMTGPINRIRRANRLPPVRRIMHDWWLSPDRILAMYPGWFAPQTEGALKQLRHVGFPLDDGAGEAFTPPTDRPVVFTTGTANRHSREFFQRAASQCSRQNIPGLLLSSHSECFPAELPPGVRGLGYVPLSQLLPHCRAILHHGGIGTTSQSLRAGIPQIIRPMAFDQFDNAVRVERLGCGRTLRRDRDLGELLQQVLADSQIAVSAREVAGRFAGPSGATRAAQEIHAVMNGRTVKV
ncbi:glycosyltransferase [Roseiconus nitratireducens]|uniref:Glycosyltransferase n=1 Tax=Roseiconus nitratireducens TaxID=2605748 RepID=A0A5M6CX95_9BACT|nr:nucleotide disphospho-sugar-binding domain-containing protein [Roseiconus nitratireducens]KAA5539841.1 glycosyltransferase [Roseiconus nitratireducens]